jgi:hypothetical protein
LLLFVGCCTESRKTLTMMVIVGAVLFLCQVYSFIFL